MSETRPDSENAVPESPSNGLSFWRHRTVEELAKAQGVKPITDVKVLLGGWPDDVDDGFEEALAEMRRS